jgi:hypothetical protein
MITSQRVELPSEIKDYFVTWTGLGLFITRVISQSLLWGRLAIPLYAA